MIKVLWQVPQGNSWLGGVNYFRNLLLALHCVPECNIQPVVSGNPASMPSPLNACPAFAWGAVLPRHTWRGFWFRVRRKIFNEVQKLEDCMLAQDIHVLSHSLTRSLNSGRCVEICWIPDFQHIHLPSFFSKEECNIRSSNFSSIAENANIVILSSEDARKDFASLFPKYAHKARVLSFVALPPDVSGLSSTDDVLGRYGINEPFIHIPNQLWIHKNHRVAIDALEILRKQYDGVCPLIVSTGHTEDYRHPDFFKQIQALVADKGISERFRFLGVVPFNDLVVLMRSAICMLNPSLFEGWSTTVEEAKSMGKRLILSDIPVHLEQNPGRGLYFSAHDPYDLASKIDIVMRTYDPDEEIVEANKAMNLLPDRMADYGRRYQNIVLEALEKRAG